MSQHQQSIAVPDGASGAPVDLTSALPGITALISSIEGSSVRALTVELAGVRITLERDPSFAAVAPPAPATASPARDQRLMSVTSPLVGAFYRSPKPDSPPFVTEGDHVTRGQVVAIIEAMKMMNEVQSDHDGWVVEIPVESGSSVEYGQTLLVLSPDGPEAV